jgi:hypothetical protein
VVQELKNAYPFGGKGFPKQSHYYAINSVEDQILGSLKIDGKINSCNRVLHEMLLVAQLLKKTFAFYGTKCFSQMTSAQILKLYLKSILMLSSHLLLGRPSGLFPLGS